jgi:hypothetical protein
MSSVHIFIISWVGQHEKASQIARDLLGSYEKITVIYSDPDPELRLNISCEQIRRPNHLLWADKFYTCVQTSLSDFLIVIHADCASKSWLELVDRMVAVMEKNPKVWVYSPLIEGASYHLAITKIAKIEGSQLDVVADTDGIVFCLSRAVQDRMKKVDYTNNTIGWGISAMFCAFAFASGRLVVVDRSVRCFHPSSRGYDGTNAWGMRMKFLQQLSMVERIQSKLLHSHISLMKKKLEVVC